jgi:hypothetical protein
MTNLQNILGTFVVLEFKMLEFEIWMVLARCAWKFFTMNEVWLNSYKNRPIKDWIWGMSLSYYSLHLDIFGALIR